MSWYSYLARTYSFRDEFREKWTLNEHDLRDLLELVGHLHGELVPEVVVEGGVGVAWGQLCGALGCAAQGSACDFLDLCMKSVDRNC